MRAKNRPVYGVGVSNANYEVQPIVKGKRVMCPIYRRWTDMLKRCYAKKYHYKQPSYVGCSVCKEWQTFSNFSKWMKLQNWEGRQLDKDIIKPLNREYSPEKCMFIPREINSLFISSPKRKGQHPLGVTQTREKFIAQIRRYGELKYLGIYTTPEEAQQVYLTAKVAYVREIAESKTGGEDIRLKPALLRWCDSQTTR